MIIGRHYLKFDDFLQSDEVVGQFFFMPPKSIKTDITLKQLENWKAQTRGKQMVVHASSSVNLCRGDAEHKVLPKIHLEFLLEKASYLGIQRVVTACGDYKSQSRVTGIETLKRNLSSLREYGGTRLLVKNAPGYRNMAGSHLEGLRKIAEDTGVGVCLDTQHAYACGYDLNKPGVVQTVLDTLGRKLELVHLNGNTLRSPLSSKTSSKGALNSVENQIALASLLPLFRYCVEHKIPMVLERSPNFDILEQDYIERSVKYLFGKEDSLTAPPVRRRNRRS